MKLNKLVLVILFVSNFCFSSTTMCFKENYSSINTIEVTALDGGVCASKKSVEDMRKSGWVIDDIKITPTNDGSNYVYIFKKNTPLANIGERKLEEKILSKLQKRKEEKSELKKRKILETMSKDGRRIYLDKCQRCHGAKAQLRAYGTSRPLIKLSLSDLQVAIRNYVIEDYSRGKAFIMRPYAVMLKSQDIKNIYSYIKSLRQEDKEGINN